MAYCPNCGTEYPTLPQRCQCGYLFGAPTSISQPTPEPGRFDFTGDGGALLILYLKLIFFSIFTLGIYSFWGRNAVRKYLWSHIRFAGQPFDYHGTGKELFFGWLKLIGVIIIVYSAAGLLIFSLGRKAEPIIGLLFLAGFALIAPLAINGAVRYRWSRTSWQGRRFAYKGDLMQLATIFLPGLLLTVITLTLYMPIFAMNMRRYIVNNTWYGGQQFQFDGKR